jgi:RNA polymerase sigma factor (sigma-70 family)
MWLFGKKYTANDEELVVQYYSTGNKQLVGQLFERHVKTVFGVCLYYFKDTERAKDEVMQIFEKLIVELRKSEVKNFKGWLSFVVRNHCLSELRKTKGKYYVPETYLDFEYKDAELEEEERIAGVSDEQMEGHLKEVIPMLKDKQRVCIELFYLKNKSYQEVADETGYTIAEVKSYLQNGKRNLKLLIEEKVKNRTHAA